MSRREAAIQPPEPDGSSVPSGSSHAAPQPGGSAPHLALPEFLMEIEATAVAPD